MDWLSIAVGITALGAIALAFWIAPEIGEIIREHRLRGQIRRALDDACAEIFGDVAETPEEMRTGRRSQPSGGWVGKANPSDTHTSDIAHRNGDVTR